MDELKYDLFDDDAEAPAVPRRSTLYHLPTIGGGTPHQESLLNYVHRLAREHRVKVMDMLIHIVLPRTNISVNHGRFKFATQYSRTVNGYGKYATEVSCALQLLTCKPDLQATTFMPWAALLDGKGSGLLHPTRTWCPDCLAEAEERREPLNFPLLWACSSVTHCLTHLCELQTTCLKCAAKQKPICDSAHYGRCNACGASLAWRSSLFQSGRLPRRQEFVVKGIGDMLALGSSATGIALPQRLSRGIQRIADTTHSGSVFLLGRAINILPSTLIEWANSRMQPRLDSFIELCYRLGTPPLEMLGDLPVNDQPRLLPGNPPLTRPTYKLAPEKLREVAAEIRKNTLFDDLPPTLVELAAKHGTSVGYLKYRLPEDCRALMDRYRHIRSILGEQRRADEDRRARNVARQLFDEGTHLPRVRLQQALAANGLTLRAPRTRAVAFGEFERLREDALRQLQFRDPDRSPVESGLVAKAAK